MFHDTQFWSLLPELKIDWSRKIRRFIFIFTMVHDFFQIKTNIK